MLKNEELIDATSRNSHNGESIDLSDMPPLESDEEVKKGKGLEILTPNNY